VTDERPRSILLIDSHVPFREALALVLENSRRFAELTEAATGRDAVGMHESFDVALVGSPVEGMRLADLVHRLRRVNPSTCVVVLVNQIGDDECCLACEAGANKVLSRHSPLDELISTLATVRPGTSAFDRETTLSYVSRALDLRQMALDRTQLRDRLTRREIEILEHLAQGRNDRDIALQLAISVETVRTHFSRILEKLEVRTRIQALIVCHKYGLLEPNGSRRSRHVGPP
jgi:NarL family two-component system response regulator LiaR